MPTALPSSSLGKNKEPIDKAALIAATIAKATNADVIRFGNDAEWTNYNKNHTVFDIAKQFAHSNMGCTYLLICFGIK